MKRTFLALALAAPLALGGCAGVIDAANTACNAQAKMPANAVAALDSLDPHSALGIYWADAKSACANGVPVASVSSTWREQLWGSVKALAPTIIPWLIGLL